MPALTRHFLTGDELSRGELLELVERAAAMKADPLAARPLEGRSVALVFERPSTRTRLSFEAGVFELGGHPLVLRSGELQLSRGESLRDTALVLSRHVAAIGIRTGPHADVVELADHSAVPGEAVADAHAVYADVWVSMGDEDTADQRRADLAPYRIDDALLDRAAPN